jgi:carbamoyl-phosphate synthase large subunit
MIYETLLITGCGGDIALNLGVIARDSGAAYRLVGTDTHDSHPGRLVFDICETLPAAGSEGYLESLDAFVRKHSVDAIVPMSEAEIGRLAAENCLGTFAGCDVISANRLAVETGLDKYKTYTMLRDAGLPAPWTFIVGENEPPSYPCIIKPRSGRGGKGVVRVETDTAKSAAFGRSGDIWQELILPDGPEYTCGVYRCANGEIRTLIFDRKLQGGVTQTAEVVTNTTIDNLLREIATALDLRGSINIQLRVDLGGPKVFEINPRFSSTVGFRHSIGFRDFIWALLEKRGMSLETYAAPKPGTKLFRGVSHFVLRP